jgi:hypothetical protein
MTQIITNASQLTAGWLTETLLRNGHLRQGSVTKISIDTFQSFFADFYRLQITYSGDAQPSRLPARMILKVSFANAADAAGNGQVLEMGRAEVLAYRKLQAAMSKGPGAPFPRCFEAAINEETGRSHLLLEDLSDTHVCGNTKEDIAVWQWERAAETLAKFHAFWWENEALGQMGQLLTVADIDAIEARMKTDLPKFFAGMGAEITPAIRALYEKALAFLPGFWRKRYTHLRRNTLIHGDAHSWNFLFPKEAKNGRAYMIDLATLRVRPPTNDLAYLMAMKWNRDPRARLEMPLLRHYHAALTGLGIEEYSWEDCLLNYRYSILTHLFTPVGQCAGEFLSPDIWQANFRRLIAACEDLNCEELLGHKKL